jgi:hypothetical protein
MFVKDVLASMLENCFYGSVNGAPNFLIIEYFFTRITAVRVLEKPWKRQKRCKFQKIIQRNMEGTPISMITPKDLKAQNKKNAEINKELTKEKGKIESEVKLLLLGKPECFSIVNFK